VERPHLPCAAPKTEYGIVVIGRNEGERLVRCLDSLPSDVSKIVYVDSNSTDGSVAMARARGVAVVELDPSIPFSAARARNAGVDHLTKHRPELAYVQFIDGDCEIAPEWCQLALEAMRERPELVAVCGRRRERYPERSIYNRLMDMEWNTKIGDTLSCGGDSLMRLSAFREAGGFNPHLIAGEEPDLCIRMRAGGGVVSRLDAEMTLHDAAMTRFAQWWRRSLRTGYMTGLSSKDGRSLDRQSIQEALRIYFWGIILPLIALCLAPATGGHSLWLLLLYPLWVVRIAKERVRDHRDPPSHALLYALACMAGKLPNALGQARFLWHRLRGSRSEIVEYK